MLSFLAALASGALVHIFIFRNGEWDTSAPQIVLTYLLITLTGTFLFNETPSFNNENSVQVTPRFASLIVYHILGVYGSIIVYRGFLHRLSRKEYPGPFLARFSNFHLAWLATKALRVHEEIHELHGRYGDYVRTGARELSIIDPEAMEAIYGSSSKCSKGPIYTLLDPRTNLSSTRDKKEHARRRKAWDRGFNTKALQSYEPIVSQLSDDLMQIIDERAGEPFNITEWIDKYAFEVMGSLTFGKPFNMLKEKKNAYFLDVIRHDMNFIGYLLHSPWLSYLLMRTPLLNRNHLDFWRWIENEFDERIQRGQVRPDIFNWIHEAYLRGPQAKEDRLKLHGDGYLIIVAGSDTTSSTITHLLFYLSCNPSLVARLQQQIDELPEINNSELHNVELLDACINETLRLRPAVPAGLQRVTPKGGMQIGDRYIPSDVIVKIPMYSLFRDPRSFEQPNEFIPERFTTRPELVINPSIFAPFLTGPYACVGRRLALMEIRRVIAKILQSYDISLGPFQTKDGFLGKNIDAFTLVPGPLVLRFTKRAQVG
ncbi:cytochrome P450 monooxygenase [Dactylonectria macrodidyma]|uniref:Cytochrome P450 monooxygenase n=1 Tax=Dactylonectria macrodidyma TaxID=307937 RepID=A0A9P9F4B2_9HYPO|nr:cytochrome P450 monooxygenase [Dactylonectria macrodidyma]